LQLSPGGQSAPLEQSRQVPPVQRCVKHWRTLLQGAPNTWRGAHLVEPGLRQKPVGGLESGAGG
jgi:hypothetical protein